MKNTLLFLLLFIAGAAFSQNAKYTLTGDLQGQPDGMVYLKQRVDGEIVNVDSAKCVNGKFQMKGSIPAPDTYALILGERKQVSLILENKAISITGNVADAKSIVISGSASQDEMKKVDNMSSDISAKMRELYPKYSEAKQKSDAAGLAFYEKKLDSLSNVQSDLMKDFVKNNPNSFVAPIILQRIQYGMEADELQGYLGKFSPEVMKSSSSKSLAARVAVLQRVSVGKNAPDFSQADSIGTPVKLSDVYSKHKYTLVDFWASWCGPCRGENPNVVAVWKEYNGKGFHVMGVSYDTDKAKWLAAIVSDKLTWTQVSDLKGWGNATAKIYGINSIPANLLLDSKGNIVAKNLRGEDLKKKIAELLQ